MKIKEEHIPQLIKEGHYNEVIPLLYKKVFPYVRKYVVTRNGRKEDAFDVFQEALLEFYLQITNSTFDPKYKVYGYLFKFSVKKWINKIRRDKKIELKDDMLDFDAEEEATVNFELIGKDENLLQTLFAPIGSKCIELLTYTIYYNLMIEDIALRMGFPSAASVKMQQQRCKQKLLQEIEKRPELLTRLKSNG